MKKLLLLTLMLLSVSGFAQYKATPKKGDINLSFIFENDTVLTINDSIYSLDFLKEIEDTTLLLDTTKWLSSDTTLIYSMYYDAIKIDTPRAYNHRVYPENTVSDADKLAAKAMMFISIWFGILVVLMTINLILNDKNK